MGKIENYVSAQKGAKEYLSNQRGCFLENVRSKIYKRARMAEDNGAVNRISKNSENKTGDL